MNQNELRTSILNKSQKVLSDIIVYMKYVKYVPEKKRRETWEELCERNKRMHILKFPQISDLIEETYQYVLDKKILPSMRSMQFSGLPIEKNNCRMYNCSFSPIDDVRAFDEAMYLLLCGSGVGFSVQKHNIEKLPQIHQPDPNKVEVFVIPDSIEGWAEAARRLIASYFTPNSPTLELDYSLIRPKGSLIKTSGAKAPGPEPLLMALTEVRHLFKRLLGSGQKNLRTIDAYDIVCHLAVCVVSGGVRRSATICLFDKDDELMLNAKTGEFWNTNSQRCMSNNSVVLDRANTTKEEFFKLWEIIKKSGVGEPGLFWTNDVTWGTNPCVEISLQPHQFCNLTEINANGINNQEELELRAKYAAILGTLQASYTNFPYLRPIWKETSEKGALLGVSLTGQASNKNLINLDLAAAAKKACESNEEVAKLIGINPAERVTCIKPSGTASGVLGTSSGIHAWHSKYYIRRIRVLKNEDIYGYLLKNLPQLIEDDVMKPEGQAVISIPMKAPENAIIREEESSLELLNRVKTVFQNWVLGGHQKGVNTNNISVTVSVKDNEWEPIGQWMWNNKEFYNGISILPFENNFYPQMPFEAVTEEKYLSMESKLDEIDLSQVIEEDNNTMFLQEMACAGGKCDLI